MGEEVVREYHIYESSDYRSGKSPDVSVRKERGDIKIPDISTPSPVGIWQEVGGAGIVNWVEQVCERYGDNGLALLRQRSVFLRKVLMEWQ